MPLSNYPQPTAVVQHLYDRATTWLLRSYPLKDLPLNIRPGMIIVTAAWIILLGILGMAPLPDLPVNDKALHFVGMGFATFLLYFTVEVPDGVVRRAWWVHRAPLLVGGSFGFVVGGVLSEFVQSMLPWKTFQWGDILANLVGASLFLYLAHLLHIRSRKRQELNSLYQPLSASRYRDAQGREHTFDGTPVASSPAANQTRHARSGSNVWEEGSEASIDSTRNQAVFDLGDEDDEPTPVKDSGRLV